MTRLVLRGVLALVLSASFGGGADAQNCAPPDNRNKCKTGCTFMTINSSGKVGGVCRRPTSVMTAGNQTYACFDPQQRNCILIARLAGNSCRAAACVGSDVARLSMQSIITPASAKTGNRPVTPMMPAPAMNRH